MDLKSFRCSIDLNAELIIYNLIVYVLPLMFMFTFTTGDGNLVTTAGSKQDAKLSNLLDSWRRPWITPWHNHTPVYSASDGTLTFICMSTDWGILGKWVSKVRLGSHVTSTLYSPLYLTVCGCCRLLGHVASAGCRAGRRAWRAAVAGGAWWFQSEVGEICFWDSCWVFNIF